MKTKISMTLAILLGLFTFCLPALAGDREHHIEEKTVIEIPIVGKISTISSSYLSDCKLMEKSTIRMHNSLVKMLADSDGKSEHSQLSDMCDEVQWEYNSELATWESSTFAEIRKEIQIKVQNAETHIDMESDQNDINDLPRMTREIVGGEKNINGFPARKVVTRVHLEDRDNPLIIEEYYSTRAKALTEITKKREDLRRKLEHDVDDVEGVPDFITLLYDAIKADDSWARPKGEVIRFVIQLLDDEDDQLFTMNYDVVIAETGNYQAEHFQLK